MPEPKRNRLLVVGPGEKSRVVFKETAVWIFVRKQRGRKRAGGIGREGGVGPH